MYGYRKIRDRCYDTYNLNSRERENVISTLINNLLVACGIVNGNVCYDTFNTWLKKILVPKLPEFFLSLRIMRLFINIIEPKKY